MEDQPLVNPAVPQTGTTGSVTEGATAYDALLKADLGPFLRSHGFRGSGGRYRQVSSTGDTAMVVLQGSSSSNLVRKQFYLNVGVVLAPEWEFRTDHARWQLTQPSAGVPDLYARRMAASGATPGYGDLAAGMWWRIDAPNDVGYVGRWVITDLASAHRCAEMMQECLLSARGIPALRLMLDRERYLSALKGHSQEVYLPGGGKELAFLCADAGDLAGAEAGLDRLAADLGGTHPLFPHWQRWVRARAAKPGSTAGDFLRV